MNRVIMKWFTLAGVALAVILGCDSVINHIVEESTDGSGERESHFAVVDSAFSTAPVSPGGTGGVAAEEGEVVGDETRSFFTAYQIDPEAEDTSGPKFVVSADVDRDGLLDLVSGWNQSQPVQLHLQRRDAEDNISFRTITLAGTSPVAVIAGVEVGQINDDNGDGTIDDDDWLDVVVLSKTTGATTWCPTAPPSLIGVLNGQIIVYFSPANSGLIADGAQWEQMLLVNPFVRDPWVYNQFPGREDEDFEVMKTQPEWGGFTALAVANVDGQPGDDIIVAINPGECKELGQEPPINTVDLWTNPGPGLAESSELWGAPPPDTQSRNVPISLMGDAPPIKDIAVMDVDNDGDLDVIATYTTSISLNVRWARNPLIAHTAGGPDGYDEVIDGASDGWRFYASGWEERPIGQVDPGADMLDIGDLDNDGFDDIIVRSTLGQLVQWFRHPNDLTVQPEFPPGGTAPDRPADSTMGRYNFVWPVFTLTEFDGQEPEAFAIGDVTGDGKVEMAIAAEGAVFWYDGSVGETVYDPWTSNTIIQDSPVDAADATVAPTSIAGAGVGVTAVDTSTSINELLIVDLDADGRNDIVGTLDRRSGAGLSDDRLVWYRNTKTEEEPVAGN